MEIAGLSALVTGGGSGLGAATAELLAARGARVAVMDRNAEAAAGVAAKVRGLALPADVTSEAEVAAALDKAAALHGVPRAVVLCAGIGGAARILGRDGPHDLALFERMVRVNLVGSFNVMRLAAQRIAAVPPLAAGEGGVVVMTASVAAFEGQVGQAAYSASKGGVAGMTLPAARELARFGIRVVTLAPGIFRTPMLSDLPAADQDALGRAIPFPGRLGDPAEYAALVAHVLENRYLNGETIRIDGALRLAPRWP